MFKINIIKQEIDLEKLKNAISLNENNNIKYLIMNENTLKLIIHQQGYIFTNSKGVFKFYNCFVAICNKLEDGEVELI